MNRERFLAFIGGKLYGAGKRSARSEITRCCPIGPHPLQSPVDRRGAGDQSCSCNDKSVDCGSTVSFCLIGDESSDAEPGRDNRGRLVNKRELNDVWIRPIEACGVVAFGLNGQECGAG